MRLGHIYERLIKVDQNCELIRCTFMREKEKVKKTYLIHFISQGHPKQLST